MKGDKLQKSKGKMGKAFKSCVIKGRNNKIVMSRKNGGKAAINDSASR